MSYYRNTCELGAFVTAFRTVSPHISAVKLFSLYLNDSRPNEMKNKALSLFHMKQGWFVKMGIQP